MKKFMQKINETFRENKLCYLFVLLVFCIGIVIGIYMVKYMNDVDKKDLAGYFTTFINGVGEISVDYGTLLIDVVKKNMLLIIPMIIFSVTYFGAPIILFLDLVKGFTLGYTFAFLMTTFEGKGIGLALTSIIPQNLIYIPGFIILSVLTLTMSMNKFRERFSKRPMYSSLNIKTIGNTVLVLVSLLVLGIVVETYVSPNIIKFVVSKFYM